MTLLPSRAPRRTLLLALGGAGVLLVLGAFLLLAYRARAEARVAFHEQYNRQQLTIAVQAAGSIEDLFKNLQASLNLATKLLRPVPIDAGHAGDIARQLFLVYDVIPKEPVVEFVVFDRAGVAVGMTPEDPSTIGVDYSWREYFKWARDRSRPGELYLSPFMKLQGGKSRGKMGLIMARALYGGASEFKGVAALVINFEEVAQRHVLSIHPAAGGYAWLVDNNERAVLADPAGKVGGLSFEQAFLPRWTRLYEIVSASSDGKPGFGLYDYRDGAEEEESIERLVAHAPIKIGDRLWTIGVSTPAEVVDELIGALIHRQGELALAAILLLLFGALVGVILLFSWNRMLSFEVTARTADLAERTSDLEKARGELEAAFEELLAARKLAALGNLALGLVHEIRNPLFSIRMNMQMLKKKLHPSGAVGESFEIVDAEVVRLNKLLGDVMSFARPVKLALREIDPAEPVLKILGLVHERLNASRIETDLRIAPDLSLVADPERLEQLLLNLILNAAEALEKSEGARRIVVDVSATPDGKSVEYKITDNGPGIDPADLDKIFDLFYTTKGYGGGLGLSIAQSLAVRHGGTLEAATVASGGAEFTLRLPVGGPSGQSGEGA